MRARTGYLAGFDLEGLTPEADERATRSKLLVAAVRLFADRGYEASSMRELAAEVGVKAPAIYNHFDSKAGVLASAIDYALSDFLLNTLPGLEDVPQEDRLYELLRRHVMYKTKDVAFARANDKLLDGDFMRRTLPATDYEKITAALGGYRRIVSDLVVQTAPKTENDPEVDLKVLVSALIEMCDQVSAWFRPDGSQSAEAVAEQTGVLELAESSPN